MIIPNARFKIFSSKISRNFGFTLLELVVVFSIIAILSTVGIASYVNYSKSQTLQQAYYNFFNTLTIARANAASQVKPTQCVSSSSLDGYRVIVNIVAKTYTLNAVCSSINFPISTTSLPSGVVFNSATDTPPTTTTDIFFSVLTSGVAKPGDVVLSYPSINTLAAKTVTITSVGGVQ